MALLITFAHRFIGKSALKPRILKSGVKLYIGIADYRSAEAADTESVWYGSDEIVRQMKMIDTTGKAAGTVHFRYGSVANSQALSDAVKRHFATVASSPKKSQAWTRVHYLIFFPCSFIR